MDHGLLGIRDGEGSLADPLANLISGAWAASPRTSTDQQARPAEAPLTFAQRSLWLRARLDGARSEGFVVPVVLAFTGAAFEPGRIAAALDRLVGRHHVLRTIFPTVDDEPVQRVIAASAHRLDPIDLAGETELRAALDAFHARPFALENEPPMRARLYRLGPAYHVLAITIHHIACDAWSIGLLIEELRAHYLGQPVEPLPMQIADLAMLQEAGASSDGHAERAFFRDTLHGATEPLLLPRDPVPPEVPAAADARVPISADLRRRAAAFAATLGGTAFAPLVAAYAVLLAQYTGQDNFLIGTPVAHRDEEDFEALIGCLSGTVPIPVRDISGQSLRTLTIQIQRDFLAMLDRPEISWEDIASAVDADRSNMATLCQAMFALQNAPADLSPGASWGDVEMALLPLRRPAARFGILLTLLPAGEGFAANIEYSPRQFAAEHAEALVARYGAILDRLLEQPDVPVAALDLVPDDDAAVHDQVAVVGTDGAPKPLGAVGELCVRNVPATSGCPGLPRLTAERFIPDPAVPGGRMMRTGIASRLGASPGRPLLPVADIAGSKGTDGQREPAAPSSRAAPAPAPADDAAVAILTEAWTAALDRSDFGLDDNFFALGGDSILCLKVQAMAQRAGLPFAIEQLFEHQTIRALAGAGPSGGRAEAPAADPFALLSPEDRARVPHAVAAARPLSGLQSGMLFHSRLDGAGTYHDYIRYRLHGRIDVASLRAAVDDVFAANALFSSTIDLTRYSEPLQLVWSDRQPLVDMASLADHAPAARDDVLDVLMRAELDRGFTLPDDLLMRAFLYQLDAETCVLALSFHHALLDGWSEATLVRSILDRYVALRGGDAAPLQPAADFGADLVFAEREALADPAAITFWSHQVRKPAIIELPPPASDAGMAARAAFHLDPSRAALLDTVAAQWNVPVKALLLACHARMIAATTGLDDIVTGTVFNGRPERAGGDTALGMFLNTLPLWIDTRGRDWPALARHCFEQESATMPFRHFPLARIKAMAGDRTMFGIAFAYTHFHVSRGGGERQPLEVERRDGTARNSLATAVHLSRDPASGALTLIVDAPPGHAAHAATLRDRFVRELNGLFGAYLTEGSRHVPVDGEAAPLETGKAAVRSGMMAGTARLAVDAASDDPRLDDEARGHLARAIRRGVPLTLGATTESGGGDAVGDDRDDFAALSAAHGAWPMLAFQGRRSARRSAWLGRDAAASMQRQFAALARDGWLPMFGAPGWAEHLLVDALAGDARCAPVAEHALPRAARVCAALLAGGTPAGSPALALVDETSVESQYLFGWIETGIAIALAAGAVADAAPWLSATPGNALLVLTGDGVAGDVGAVGTLAVRPANPGWGYPDDPRLTAERFVPDPEVPGGRIYRTGLAGRRCAGDRVLLMGGAERLETLAGCWIPLDLIEQVIASAVGGKVSAVVEGEAVLRIVVAAECAQEPLKAMVASELQSCLPTSWQHVRNRVLIDLRQTAVAQAAVDGPAAARARQAAPANDASGDADVRASEPLEQVIGALWAEMLGRAPKPDDDFFDLGGDSVSAMRMMAKLEELADVDLPLTLIFKNPTLRGFAGALAAGRWRYAMAALVDALYADLEAAS